MSAASDFIILGTDTDAGKTTLALLWLALRGERYDYWKPVETGDSDTLRVQQLVPGAVVHPPRLRLRTPVAPPLAARLENTIVPRAQDLAAHVPTPCAPGRRLLIETFGSPLSPLNEDELQIEFIRRLGRPTVLVTSSRVGAIGRALQALHVLHFHQIEVASVVLLGPPDPYAVAQIQRHVAGRAVACLQPPVNWDPKGVQTAAQEQAGELERIRPAVDLLGSSPLSLPTSDFGPRISDLRRRDQLHVWHPYTSLRDPDPPLEVVAATDHLLMLADGRQVIDAISSWWTILHGHRQPLLVQALLDAIGKFDHVQFAGLTHEPGVRLAELLLASTSWPDGKVFYSDNGSTAVEVALKMAYQYWCHQGQPERTLFVGFQHGYHGDTFGAMAASRDPVFFGTFAPLLFDVRILPLEAEQLDAFLDRHAHQVAAVIVEPLVQGAGGMQMHTPAELRALFEVARRHDVLFIVDEVMTGGGRLGKMWAHQAAEVTPDLICAAKTLAGGMLPLAATLAAPRLVKAFDTDDRRRTFFHGHSFTGHPLACAVAVASWQLLHERSLARVPVIEAVWRERLLPLRELPQVADVRICGSVAAIELKAAGGYLADVGRQLRRVCLDQGVFLRPLGNVLYTMPPLLTPPEALEQIAAAMTTAVKTLAPF